MIVEFDKSFYRTLNKLKDPLVLKKVEHAILKLEAANSMNDVAELNKLTGYKNYYKIRIGDYRIGLEKNKFSKN
jgi:mRNA interferase RelE/StbE